jgi:non-ribosomal peptide synthetase component F
MNVVEVAQTAAIGIEYNRDLFEPETIVRIAERFDSLLGAIAADPHRPVSALAVMSADERRHLVMGLNATAVPRDGAPSVPVAFLAAAARAPGATALVFEGAHVSYGELAARAVALARRLRELGVGPGERAALCIERSPELIVALLAILLAGGAYVPLDPDYPAERLAFMLADAAPAVLVAPAELAARLPAAGVPVVAVPKLDRPLILGGVLEQADAVRANYGVSDAVLLETILGRRRPGGRRPFELPSSQVAVAAQLSDVPDDSAAPLFERGFRAALRALTESRRPPC